MIKFLILDLNSTLADQNVRSSVINLKNTPLLRKLDIYQEC